ncbi:ornithine cyclodeaminase [Paracoccus halophilus]|uniref:Ectoine utilization protein EutC n=1 Tax=Paracoccus halophilus TaxID=376733 RepID=A0A099F2Q5_9RHOB|nr:cyclodeaminase [Paracoccus halophilus]KGJ04513.1 ectoine utilization protein EutC [Paracoccus halophilus]SFA54644.1 ornithine cyclodeaminase [Paracoccus halophilus]
MSDIMILNADQLRRRVPLDGAAIEAIERAFARLAEGGVAMPGVLSMHLPEANGEVDIKTAHIPGLPGFAVKISPGFFDNPTKGLPSTSGLMVVLSGETGRVQAVLLDDGYLTDLRTAAAGAVAAKFLARKDASRAAIFGAGMQARMQLRALRLVRPITEAVIWARDPARAENLAAELAGDGLRIRAEGDPEMAAMAADIIVTTTPARQPILRAEWLRPGQHVTAMGSDQAGKNELDPQCLVRADLYVADRVSQTRGIGELRAALDAGLIAETGAIPELGQIVAGRHPGRTSAEQITIADLTGTGVQDTAIAIHALAAFSKAQPHA